MDDKALEFIINFYEFLLFLFVKLEIRLNYWVKDEYYPMNLLYCQLDTSYSKQFYLFDYYNYYIFKCYCFLFLLLFVNYLIYFLECLIDINLYYVVIVNLLYDYRLSFKLNYLNITIKY